MRSHLKTFSKGLTELLDSVIDLNKGSSPGLCFQNMYMLKGKDLEKDLSFTSINEVRQG